MRGLLPTTADVVIVGAGSAGCVIAERLSRDSARSVVLVERGPRVWPSAAVLELSHLPIEPGTDFAVDIEEMSGLGVVRGRGLGGSSVVNGGYFLRWHPDDFVGWPDDWTSDDIAAAYHELDGPHGTMGVSTFADDELADVVEHFETYWAKELPVRAPRDAWPIIGVNRVRSNRDGRLRRTAAEAYLRPVADRSNLSVVTDAEVAQLIVSGSRVDGVRIGDEALSTGEVVLSAGTLGTAAILLHSGLGALAGIRELPIHEHREILVHYRRRDVVAHRRTALLQSVVHTADDLEIRCYSDDMANYVNGIPRSGPAIGVAVMRPGSAGSIRIGPSGPIVDLGSMDPASAHKAECGVDAVATMLASSDFVDIVEPGSIAADPVVRTSQHAWGSMPMGKRTDSLGGVDGIAGLRIVDGSLLPTAGRSGPHATIMMVAVRIADELIQTRRHGP
ncbi:mycofactocin system GMC family oxidoreductase MftG [Gordonia sp. PKS22-38]|uniref:Mycofactocin system GMC family oxidoreductase MftG n=1 Tax=Gordonia prachuapensis TaxID=3115651 RepID=A0ABU7MMG7_9ACTN|nr:mycofactocin system GMC family oxidoreductase MftG [Gordonia sp. PKS22-38]